MRAGYTQIPNIREGKPLDQFQADNKSATYLCFGEREQQLPFNACQIAEPSYSKILNFGNS